MRTPADGNPYTFGGHSLTLQSPTTTTYSIIYKGSANNVYTINNLTNSGGLIRSGGGSGDTYTLAGNFMYVAAPSTMLADQSPFVIKLTVAGQFYIDTFNGVAFFLHNFKRNQYRIYGQLGVVGANATLPS